MSNAGQRFACAEPNEFGAKPLQEPGASGVAARSVAGTRSRTVASFVVVKRGGGLAACKTLAKLASGRGRACAVGGGSEARKERLKATAQHVKIPIVRRTQQVEPRADSSGRLAT